MSRLLVAAGCLVALACGTEASTLSTLREAPAAPAPPPPARRDAPPVTTHMGPHGDPCIEVDSERGGQRITLEGRLVVDDAHEHPTRGKTHPYILRLDAPRCAIGTEETRVSELHLATVEGVELRPLVGRRVRVSGDPFSALTAWHARPVLLMTTRATPLP